ncbi:hypothetical protein MNEG_1355 [Monoraphidium neglectum]|uniref:Uncharacterized protein n=1 Tax=Monoraphidium neglectum TaxID=145388 RepID=A0A0D2N2E9_9CHLO|nr:hypothetical protein MNEG_1355 [Monoraphidium neglectum]KIZ06602.1 hypothetical protein MNEG_1355 [Monoraphidium neglectum]|eukprot:XP_013905621.1 hypothetical protein MNEG_1355 [Monoraphidium neglectum]
MRTPSGRASSAAYNDEVRANTARHALLAQLRRPPAPFGAALRAHWALTAAAAKEALQRWGREARQPAACTALGAIVQEAGAELDSLVAAWESEQQAAAAAAEPAPSPPPQQQQQQQQQQQHRQQAPPAWLGPGAAAAEPDAGVIDLT